MNNRFHQALLELELWYDCHSRNLPWREEPSPYRVWISEIMLQQTQVTTVIPYFNRFIEQFPTLKSLACASEEEVLALWSGLGYYSRARNLLKTARFLTEKGLNQLPSTREKLEALSGIGPYTAGAILSIAFGQYEAILDGNLERIFSRLLQIKRNRKYKERLWKISWRFIKSCERIKINPSKVNQALMEMGTLCCKQTLTLCQECPLNRLCQSRRFGTQLLFPEKQKRIAKTQLAEQCYFIQDVSRESFLLMLDEHSRWRKGLWDLPFLLPSGFLWEEKEAVRSVKLNVTHHEIHRTIVIGSFLSFDEKENFFSDEKNKNLHYQWVKISQLKAIPKSGALLKSLKALGVVFEA